MNQNRLLVHVRLLRVEFVAMDGAWSDDASIDFSVEFDSFRGRSYEASFTSGGFHVPSRMDGGFSLGQ